MLVRRELVCPWLGCDKTFSQKSNFEDHYKTQYALLSPVVSRKLLIITRPQYTTSPRAASLSLLENLPLPLGDSFSAVKAQERVPRQGRREDHTISGLSLCFGCPGVHFPSTLASPFYLDVLRPTGVPVSVDATVVTEAVKAGLTTPDRRTALAWINGTCFGIFPHFVLVINLVYLVFARVVQCLCSPFPLSIPRLHFKPCGRSAPSRAKLCSIP